MIHMVDQRYAQQRHAETVGDLLAVLISLALAVAIAEWLL